jgi:hypothetical protein
LRRFHGTSQEDHADGMNILTPTTMFHPTLRETQTSQNKQFDYPDTRRVPGSTW